MGKRSSLKGIVNTELGYSQNSTRLYRYGFNTQEKTDEIAGAGNHTTALFWEYDTRSGRRWNLDPKPQVSISDYAVNGNNPILNNDPNGDWCIPCLTAGAGALIGAGVEAGTQLYQTGKINNWKAVGGAAVQGAVTGFAAGATGGMSLFATAGVAAGANVVGGAANNLIQGKPITVKSTATDAAVGAALGGVGYGMGKAISATQNAKYLYHYTNEKASENILKTGFKVDEQRPFIYLTNKSNLSPLQAQIELALPANKPLPTSVLKVEVSTLNPIITRQATGNLPSMGAGGGKEFLFNQNIPANLIQKVK